jgi:thiamine-phosphate pyrophosphorylase
MDDEKQIYRVIDANLNRLREGLRVCEEYFRFIKNEKTPSQKIKELRHKCKDLQVCFDEKILFSVRNSENDPFCDGFEAAEKTRKNAKDLLDANVKRCQEAARAIEEFAKLLENENASKIAKTVRFELYTFEKEIYSGR